MDIIGVISWKAVCILRTRVEFAAQLLIVLLSSSLLPNVSLPFTSSTESQQKTSLPSSDVQAHSSLVLGEYSEADLDETIEVQFTDEIRELAANLSYSPVRMYEYVRNNFDYEVYYGSLKGAQATLWEMAGNDFDLASLLIALYRVSGIPARYVYGNIEVPIKQVMNWVGVSNRSVAGNMFATGAVPSFLLEENGVIKWLRMDHVWVKARVPVDYIPFSGSVNVAGYTWVQLDPSFKQYAYVEGVNVTARTFLNRLESTVIVNETDSYNKRVRDYLEADIPNAALGEVLRGRKIQRHEFGILPEILPYNVLTESGEYAEVPDDLRHKVAFEVLDELSGFTDISYTVSLPEVAGKRITVSYFGATLSDEELIKSYENETVLPAYLINLKAELRINGEAVVNGVASIVMGSRQNLVLTFTAPNEPVDIAQTKLVAGAYYAVGLNLRRIPSRLMEKSTDNFEKILADNTALWKTDDVLGEILHATVVAYSYEVDFVRSLMERIFDVGTLRKTSAAVVSANINVRYTIEGTPYEASISGGLSLDAFRAIASPFSRKEDGNIARNFMRSSGSWSSALEHSIFEQLWSEYSVIGISTVKALAVATEQGIPIFKITADNLNQVLPQLMVDQLIKDDIVNAIWTGKAVTVPQREITLGNWTGTGYVIEDPQTGAGAYKIGGAIGGGEIAWGPILTRMGLTATSLLIELTSLGNDVANGVTSFDVAVKRIVDWFIREASLSQVGFRIVPQKYLWTVPPSLEQGPLFPYQTGYAPESYSISIELVSGTPELVTLSAMGPEGLSLLFLPQTGYPPFKSTVVVGGGASRTIIKDRYPPLLPGTYTLLIKAVSQNFTTYEEVTLLLQYFYIRPLPSEWPPPKPPWWGQISQTKGDVTIKRGGQNVQAAEDDPVGLADTVRGGKDSIVAIIGPDGSVTQFNEPVSEFVGIAAQMIELPEWTEPRTALVFNPPPPPEWRPPPEGMRPPPDEIRPSFPALAAINIILKRYVGYTLPWLLWLLVRTYPVATLTATLLLLAAGRVYHTYQNPPDPSIGEEALKKVREILEQPEPLQPIPPELMDDYSARARRTIVTPDGVITWNGTEFTLDVDVAGTRVRVFNGTVEAWSYDCQSTLVTTNQQLTLQRLQNGTTVLQSSSFDPTSIDKWWLPPTEQPPPDPTSLLRAIAVTVISATLISLIVVRIRRPRKPKLVATEQTPKSGRARAMSGKCLIVEL